MILLAPYDEYVSRLEELGFRVVTVNMHRKGLNPIRELILLLQIFRIYRSLKPTAVFNFTIKCVVYGSFAAMLSGIKSRINAVAGLGTIFTNTGVKYRILKPAISGLLKLALCGRSNRLIVQNTDDLAVFIDNGIVHAERVTLIRGSGVCAQRFTPAYEEREMQDGKVRVLFAARLLWAKGLSDFIKLAEKNEHRKNVEFLIAGEPDLGNPDSATSIDQALWAEQPNVKVLGHVDDMPKLLTSVDIVCLPSNYGEGVPRILVEAAATGLPLVGYDIPGTREIITDGKNGFLASSRDFVALSRGIHVLIDEPAVRLRFGKASRLIFMKSFDAESVNRRSIDVIESALDMPSLSQVAE